MRYILKKGSVHLGISYENGWGTSELFGEQFCFEDTGQYAIFSVNLSKNRKSRSNKRSHDIEELIEDIEKFKILEFNDEYIARQLLNFPQSTLRSNWVLELKIDNEVTYAFSVKNPKNISNFKVVLQAEQYLGEK